MIDLIETKYAPWQYMRAAALLHRDADHASAQAWLDRNIGPRGVQSVNVETRVGTVRGNVPHVRERSLQKRIQRQEDWLARQK